MERGYCYEPCLKEKWYCCHDCIREKQCVKECEEKSKGSSIKYVPCRADKEKCSIYHV